MLRLDGFLHVYVCLCLLVTDLFQIIVSLYKIYIIDYISYYSLLTSPNYHSLFLT